MDYYEQYRTYNLTFIESVQNISILAATVVSNSFLPKDPIAVALQFAYTGRNKYVKFLELVAISCAAVNR